MPEPSVERSATPRRNEPRQILGTREKNTDARQVHSTRARKIIQADSPGLSSRAHGQQMEQSLLHPTKPAGASTTAQVVTLLRRKELPLKCRRPITSFCEVALPVILCGLVLLSKLQKDSQVSVGNLTYVQDNFASALGTLSPFTFAEAQALGHGGQADDIQSVLKYSNNSNISGVPNGIWPLALYLSYAAGIGAAPFDGNYLAVTPDEPAVRLLLNETLRWPHVEVDDFDRPTIQTGNLTDKVRATTRARTHTPP